MFRIKELISLYIYKNLEDLIVKKEVLWKNFTKFNLNLSNGKKVAVYVKESKIVVHSFVEGKEVFLNAYPCVMHTDIEKMVSNIRKDIVKYRDS